MKHFWQGFSDKSGSGISFKRHLIILFFSPEHKEGHSLLKEFNQCSCHYPSVKVKIINIKKNFLKPQRHSIEIFPTILLLKNGREIDRLEDMAGSKTILEELFIKANN